MEKTKRQIYKERKWLQLAIRMGMVLFLLAGSTIGLAAPSNFYDQEILKQKDQKETLNRKTQQEAQERQDKQQFQDVFLDKDKIQVENLDIPEEPQSFYIDALKLEGEHLQEFSWIQKRLNQYSHKRIGREGINIIIKRITNELIDKGYVTTRIGIPEQDLSTGVLKLQVFPGIVREIRFEQSDINNNWQTAFPIRPGNLLNIRDIEQGLEQLKRVPSQDAQMQIAPGERVGESDIVITMKKSKPWRINFSIDDAGSKSTGKMQASTTLSIDNLVGINDLFYVNFNTDLERRGAQQGTEGNSIYFSFPYGYWTFSTYIYQNKYHQTVQGINQNFIYSGESEGNEYRIQRIIHRDQTSKTSLQFRMIQKRNKNFIEDTEFINQRRNTTADEVSFNHRQYYGKSILDIELAHRWGVPWFGAQSDNDSSVIDGPTSRYKLWTLDIGLNKPVQMGQTEGRYTCSLKAQYTRDTLYVADFLSIGNRYTVRGFDGEQTLAAENGWYIQNELSFPLKNQSEIYLGLDYGQISGNSAKWLPGTKLAGAVLGTRGEVNNLRYDVFIGWPIHYPEGFSTAKPSVGFTMSCQI